MLILEGAQAGLSWETILKKRDNYRKAFDGFDFRKVASYGEDARTRLIANAGIVRNRLKIDAAITNARKAAELVKKDGDFSRLLWSFVGGEPRIRGVRKPGDIVAQSDESGRMSRELLRLGFKFVGPTICYAFMQATGMVNDHEVDCFRFAELGGTDLVVQESSR